MKARLKKEILLALNAADGMPLPESALVAAVKTLARDARPTESDIADALASAAAEGYIAGVTDDFTRTRTWTLTEKGIHKARQLA